MVEASEAGSAKLHAVSSEGTLYRIAHRPDPWVWPDWASAYRADAVSKAGAVGLMQLMPATARRYGVDDSTDPYQNLTGGTAYLRDLHAL